MSFSRDIHGIQCTYVVVICLGKTTLCNFHVSWGRESSGPLRTGSNFVCNILGLIYLSVATNDLYQKSCYFMCIHST